MRDGRGPCHHGRDVVQLGHVVVQLGDGVVAELVGADRLLPICVRVHGAHVFHCVLAGLQDERRLRHVEVLVVQLGTVPSQHLPLLADM